jgi:HAD superfamily hydrolase (TIGR01509 family)
MINTPTNTIRALLFDLGGVVIDIDFDRVFTSWAGYANQSLKTIKSRFAIDSYYERHERGEIEAAEYFNSLRKSLGINITDNEFEEGWNSIYVGEIPGIAKLLSDVKEKCPIHSFTNSNKLHQLVWSKKFESILGLFQNVFVSSEMGKRKPEPDAFRFISAEIGLKPKNILFFDDSIENVEGAKSVGMKAAQVSTLLDIKEALKAYML